MVEVVVGAAEVKVELGPELGVLELLVAIERVLEEQQEQQVWRAGGMGQRAAR